MRSRQTKLEKEYATRSSTKDTEARQRLMNPLVESVASETLANSGDLNGQSSVSTDRTLNILPVSDKKLKEVGATRDDYNLFVTIANNAYNVLVEKNVMLWGTDDKAEAMSKRAKEAIVKSTGMSLEDFQKLMFNKGKNKVSIRIKTGQTEIKPEHNEIYFNINVLKALRVKHERNVLGVRTGKVRDTTIREKARQVFSIATTIIHEFIHYADVKTNRKYKKSNPNFDTGQWGNIKKIVGGKSNLVSGHWADITTEKKSLLEAMDGVQAWKTSLVGHRGSDFIFYLFGGMDNKEYIDTGDSIFNYWDQSMDVSGSGKLKKRTITEALKVNGFTPDDIEALTANASRLPKRMDPSLLSYKERKRMLKELGYSGFTHKQIRDDDLKKIHNKNYKRELKKIQLRSWFGSRKEGLSSSSGMVALIEMFLGDKTKKFIGERKK